MSLAKLGRRGLTSGCAVRLPGGGLSQGCVDWSNGAGVRLGAKRSAPRFSPVGSSRSGRNGGRCPSKALGLEAKKLGSGEPSAVTWESVAEKAEEVVERVRLLLKDPDGDLGCTELELLSKRVLEPLVRHTQEFGRAYGAFLAFHGGSETLAHLPGLTCVGQVGGEEGRQGTGDVARILRGLASSWEGVRVQAGDHLAARSYWGRVVVSLSKPLTRLRYRFGSGGLAEKLADLERDVEELGSTAERLSDGVCSAEGILYEHGLRARVADLLSSSFSIDSFRLLDEDGEEQALTLDGLIQRAKALEDGEEILLRTVSTAGCRVPIVGFNPCSILAGCVWLFVEVARFFLRVIRDAALVSLILAVGAGSVVSLLACVGVLVLTSGLLKLYYSYKTKDELILGLKRARGDQYVLSIGRREARLGGGSFLFRLSIDVLRVFGCMFGFLHQIKVLTHITEGVGKAWGVASQAFGTLSAAARAGLPGRMGKTMLGMMATLIALRTLRHRLCSLVRLMKRVLPACLTSGEKSEKVYKALSKAAGICVDILIQALGLVGCLVEVLVGDGPGLHLSFGPMVFKETSSGRTRSYEDVAVKASLGVLRDLLSPTSTSLGKSGDGWAHARKLGILNGTEIHAHVDGGALWRDFYKEHTPFFLSLGADRPLGVLNAGAEVSYQATRGSVKRTHDEEIRFKTTGNSVSVELRKRVEEVKQKAGSHVGIYAGAGYDLCKDLVRREIVPSNQFLGSGGLSLGFGFFVGRERTLGNARTTSTARAVAQKIKLKRSGGALRLTKRDTVEAELSKRSDVDLFLADRAVMLGLTDEDQTRIRNILGKFAKQLPEEDGIARSPFSLFNQDRTSRIQRSYVVRLSRESVLDRKMPEFSDFGVDSWHGERAWGLRAALVSQLDGKCGAGGAAGKESVTLRIIETRGGYARRDYTDGLAVGYLEKVSSISKRARVEIVISGEKGVQGAREKEQSVSPN